MKRAYYFIALFCWMLVTMSCHWGNSIVISNDNDNLSIRYAGDIKFSEDETAIKSISHNGYLKYARNDKRLTAEPDGEGNIKYEMYDNGKKLNLSDPDGKVFLADVVKDMIDMGFDAKDRLDRIYKKGGNRAVLDEINNLKIDYVKALYIDFLLSQDSVSPDEAKDLARKINLQVGSDYDKGRLLIKFPEDCLRDSVVAHAWFVAVKNIGGDYEKANALAYMARAPLSSQRVSETVEIASSIGSDYEKSNLLKELIYKQPVREEDFDKIIDAVSNIGSDYEKSNLLKQLVEKLKPTGGQFEKLLDATVHVGSDYDRTNLIKDLMESGLPDNKGFDKLLMAIVYTGSDYDKANLLRDLMTKDIKTDDQWISVINATAEISSESDRSGMLVSLSLHMPKSEPVKTAYLKVARTINSESDLGKALRAVE